MKTKFNIVVMGVLTAIASSLCCIVPVLALLSGTTGIAANFSWLEPYRGYLILFTIVVLSVAWYQKLKPKKKIDCACDDAKKETFLQSKIFLGLVTFFAITMTLFPYYSKVFYTEKKQAKVFQLQTAEKVLIPISGMTCVGCETHITHEINQLKGIEKATVSYQKEQATVFFDTTKTTLKEIKKAIKKAGYTIKK